MRKEQRDKSELRVDYRDHVCMEKEITTVANLTQFDIAEFLPLAAQVPLRQMVQPYPPEEANRALLELKCVPVRAAKVLTIGDDAGSTLRLDCAGHAE